MENDSMSFVFKDARNPDNVGRHSRGMEPFLNRWFTRAEITSGLFNVLLVNTGKDMMREKGIKLVSHDNRNSLRIKIWAETPFEANIFLPQELGQARDVFEKLSGLMDRKRFISEQDLWNEPSHSLNPIPIPSESDSDTTVEGSAPVEPAEAKFDTGTDTTTGFRLKAFNDSPSEQSILLADVRARIGDDRYLIPSILRSAVVSVYAMKDEDIHQAHIAQLVRTLLGKGFLERVAPRRYRLSVLADMFLVRHELLTEDQAVKELPPIPHDPQMDEGETDLSGEVKHRTVRTAPLAHPLAANLTKLESVIAEMESVNQSLAQCEERRVDFEAKRKRIDEQLEEIRQQAEKFTQTLADPKYAKAKALLADLEQFT